MNKDIIYNFIGAFAYTLFIGGIIVAGVSFILWASQTDEDTIDNQQRMIEMNQQISEIQGVIDEIKVELE